MLDADDHTDEGSTDGEATKEEDEDELDLADGRHLKAPDLRGCKRLSMCWSLSG